jgi:hypothetical protein
VKLAITALFIGMFAANVADKPKDTFAEKYFAQVDKTNTTLKEYTDASCSASDFNAKAQAFIAETDNLTKLEKQIPDDQDEVTQAHEVEVYIGFVKVANDSVDAKNACFDTTTPTKNIRTTTS